MSKLQLEGVSYACQAHLQKLSDGVTRSGFMIGDGAGVGKGRQISGIIVDNFARGRKRHVWISSSHDLRRDAERDLRDLGCYIKVIDGCKELDKETKALGLSNTCGEGVLFLTYSTLVSKGGGGGSGGKISKIGGKSSNQKTRLEQAIEWFVGGDDGKSGKGTSTSQTEKEHIASGCLIFDECHKAKNHKEAVGGGTESNSGGSKVAAAVIELQRRLINARVVYCSATGVSEIGNMAYMARLGFWGAGTPFTDSNKFIESMKHRGVGFLEMLAMEMKSSGKYVSRGLSFRAAEFCTMEAELTINQTRSYDATADFMVKLKACLVQALVETRSNGGQVWKAYWSMHQRLFKLLCVSAKVPEVVRLSTAALEEGKCVVIGMQTTGESAETWEVATMGNGGNTGSLFAHTGSKKNPEKAQDSFTSTTRAMLRFFVQTHFPTHVVDVAKPSANNSILTQDDGYFDENGVWRVPDAMGVHPGANGVDTDSKNKSSILRPHSACIEAKRILLDLVDELDLPPNPLDELIDLLGSPTAVAEMTGRRTRVVRNKHGNLTRENRGDEDGKKKTHDAFAENVDGVNISEKISFQKGAKKVAVISDAASTGISLHARKGEPNQSRRVHVTIELPWSADKAIQQLGRTHRSNQTSGPSYVMVSTNLGGEKRFAAAVATRLQSLGALTRGDRRAATGIDLSEGNLDSNLGRAALKKMYDALVSRGIGRAGMANNVALASVLSHLPSVDEVSDGSRASDCSYIPPIPSTASDYLKLERDIPGSGVAALHDELRECVVSLGVAVGLSKAGLSEASMALLDEIGPGTKDSSDVRRFLNRILGLSVRSQNLLFGYFTEVLDQEVRAAKADGKYSEGVSDLSGTNITIENTSTILKDPFGSGAELRKTIVAIDRGVSFEDACANFQRHVEMSSDQNKNAMDGFYKMKRDMYGRTQVILVLTKIGTKNTFMVTRPNTGQSIHEMERDDLVLKYKKIGNDEVGTGAKDAWEATFNMTANACMHGSSCQIKSCKIGTRLVRCCIVSGAVVPSWGVLEKVLDRHQERFHKSDRGMRAARAVAEDGEKVVGIRYPEELLDEVRDKLVEEWAIRDDMLTGVGIGANNSNVQGVNNSNDTITIDGDVKGPPAASPRRARFELVTPVDAKCAARAAAKPKTMRSFFTVKQSVYSVNGDAGDGSIHVDSKRTHGSVDLTQEKPSNDTKTKGNISSAPPVNFFGASEIKTSKKQKKQTSTTNARTPQTCPICQHVFPATSLNTDINQHVDKCVQNMG